MSWTYWQSEPNLWTVGDNAGHTDSDHTSREEAARRCAWLNGGDGEPYPAQLADPEAGGAEAEEELREIDELKTRCTYLYRLGADLEERLTRQGERLTAMERLATKQGAPDAVHTAAHSEIEQRLNALENRITIAHDDMGALGNNHQELQADVETHEAQIDKLNEQVGILQEQMSDLGDKVDEDDFNELKDSLESRITAIEDEELTQLYHRVKKLEQWRNGEHPEVKDEPTGQSCSRAKPSPYTVPDAQLPCFSCYGFYVPSELKLYTRKVEGVRQAASFCSRCIELADWVEGRGWSPGVPPEGGELISVQTLSATSCADYPLPEGTTCQCTLDHTCPGRASSSSLCTQPATVLIHYYPNNRYYREGMPVCQACAEAYRAKGGQVGGE